MTKFKITNFLGFVGLLLSGILCAGCARDFEAAYQPTAEAWLPSPSSTAATVPPISPSPTPSPAPTESHTPTQTPYPSLDPVFPQIQKICPDNRFVPLSELGLDPQTRLVVLPGNVINEDVEEISLIDPANEIPRRVANLIPRGMEVPYRWSYNVSPDGKWFVYELGLIDERITTVWVSSLDGSQSWSISQPSENSAGIWIGAEEKILLYGPGEEERNIIDLFTSDRSPIPPLPEEGLERIGYGVFAVNGIWSELYYVRFESNENVIDPFEYRVVNAQTQVSQSVFKWLSTSGFSLLDQHPHYFQDGSAIATVNQPYGLDISPILSFTDTQRDWLYEQIMRPVIVSDETILVRPSIPVPSKPAITLLADYIEGISDLEEFTNWFYILDYEDWIINDYCFDAPGFRQDVYSPDGKFVAFTRQEQSDTNPIPRSIFVINLETGYISKIDGWQFIGWAVSNE